jgi:hypothetical protein
MQRAIVLGDGRRMSLAAYVAAWKTALAADDCQRFKGSPADPRGWCGPYSRAELLQEFRGGMNDRINRHAPHYGKGRKWSQDWQASAWRLSRDVNTPRLIVRLFGNPMAREFAFRLGDRLETDIAV